MPRHTFMTLAIFLAALATMPLVAGAAAVKVEVVGKPGSWQLERGGKPFFIKGAGGGASRQVLADSGGNSIRTWGVDDLGKELDEAQKRGLTVTAGIWLGQRRHGFSYESMPQVAEQYEKARAAVLKYKDHPALLMWAVGNEMEGYEAGDDAAVWSAVNNITSMIHKVDPNHPTMTVVAEIGGKRVESINRLCPDVDVIGINSYGGGPSLAERYLKAGGTKPFVVTEFGPAGTWETVKNEWNAPTELTSTAKADRYRATYEGSISSQMGKYCLGSYAFAWGNKQEATATWFGLFLPDGSRLESADAMRLLWSGKPVTNHCPRIDPPKVEGTGRANPGQILKVSVDVTDPENDPLKIEWKLTKDPGQYQTGGDFQAAPEFYPDAIVKNGGKSVEVKMPAGGGGYWLYCTARDDHGGAAVATVPLYVNGPVEKPKAAVAKLPFTVYGDGAEPFYIPSGWIGNTAAIAMDEKSAVNPHAGPTCMKLTYKAADNFGGIVWQSPANDWGDLPGGRDLTGAKKLTFWARGESGGETVEFKMGLLGPEKTFPDTAAAGLPPVKLTKEWKQYTIDLAGKDLSRIKTGFAWVLAGQGKPATFYLDDIRYEL